MRQVFIYSRIIKKILNMVIINKKMFYKSENIKINAVNKIYKNINTPDDLYNALLRIWCEYTCAPRMRLNWNYENITLGQCSITAFLAQDIFGGKVYGVPLNDGENYHCYNFASGLIFDLTSEQFNYKLDYKNNIEQFREKHFLKQEKKLRYEYLKNELEKLTR